MSSVTGLPGTYLGQRPSAISKAAVQSGPLQTLSFSELTQYVGFPPSPSGKKAASKEGGPIRNWRWIDE